LEVYQVARGFFDFFHPFRQRGESGIVGFHNDFFWTGICGNEHNVLQWRRLCRNCSRLPKFGYFTGDCAVPDACHQGECDCRDSKQRPKRDFFAHKGIWWGFYFKVWSVLYVLLYFDGK